MVHYKKGQDWVWNSYYEWISEQDVLMVLLTDPYSKKYVGESDQEKGLTSAFNLLKKWSDSSLRFSNVNYFSL